MISRPVLGGRRLAVLALAGATLAAAITAGSMVGDAGAEPSTPSAAAAEPAAAAGPRVRVGRSVEGRPIRAVRIGEPGADRVALVVGVIHGDERAGLRVTTRLKRRYRHEKGAEIWVVDALNPDGLAAGSRKNARGVDLNRNFAHRWRGGVPRWSGYYPGRRAFSEPETRFARRLINRIKPDVSIWYHQPWGGVLACKGKPRVAYRYAKLAGLGTSCMGRGLRGTAIGWQKDRFRDATAFVVELPAGKIGKRAAGQHARAAAIVARRGAGAKPKPEGAGEKRAAGRPAPSAGAAAAPKPPIKNSHIPYGEKRRRDMARYSKRHYGKFRWGLKHPKLIVQHFAVAGSIGSIYNTFAPNRPDVEYGELPGVCSHFGISSRGFIHRFVPLTIRCRHVVGLNHVAIGIEHVGYSDKEVMKRKRQLRASLRLTKWLRCRFEIPVKRVIGHAESLSSPFYREKVKSFRGRTHSDFKRKTMRSYRAKLHRLGPC